MSLGGGACDGSDSSGGSGNLHWPGRCMAASGSNTASIIDSGDTCISARSRGTSGTCNPSETTVMTSTGAAAASPQPMGAGAGADATYAVSPVWRGSSGGQLSAEAAASVLALEPASRPRPESATLAVMPNEVLLHILGFLDVCDLLSTSRVRRQTWLLLTLLAVCVSSRSRGLLVSVRLCCFVLVCPSVVIAYYLASCVEIGLEYTGPCCVHCMLLWFFLTNTTGCDSPSRYRCLWMWHTQSRS